MTPDELEGVAEMAENYEAAHESMVPLSELRDYEVADDSVDVRGWTVSGSDGRDLGTVYDLIVDSTTMQARYLVVSLSDKAHATPGSGTSQPVLVPVSRARVHESDNRVHLDSTGAGLGQLPRYQGKQVERDYNETFGRHEEPATYAEDTHRITRSAEELRIGKRKVDAGEVSVRKHVETDRVQQPVTRTREEVHVERRPVSDADGSRAEFGDDEVRIPISEEEVTVEKRPERRTPSRAKESSDG